VLAAVLVGVPALTVMPGCPEVLAPRPGIDGNVATVRIKGETFRLEIAATPAVRTKGLGGRTEIAPDGGMIFVFPPAQVQVHEFVMRDCLIDIDIIYTDGAGRVLAHHAMKAEPPRGSLKDAQGNAIYEGEPGDWDVNNLPTRERFEGAVRYEQRLKKYSSRFPATFAIELKAGTIARLNVKDGDVLEFDFTGLKKMAR
jgi:uncharacterized membrane protein (UPF0127 family)